MNCPTCHRSVDGDPPFCPHCGAPLPRQAGPDPLIGRTLAGKFRIVQLLGEGGMGAVYVGEQQLGPKTRRVAIKTLHPHLSRDEKVRARFQREVGTLASLEHPNTVQVYDFGTSEDGLLYIVMEFVQGRSIADHLEKDGAFAYDRVQKILEQMCGSLGEAHAQGIIHRDLKPDNVVLTERAGVKDFVKVLDFGIAKRSGEEDRNEAKLTQQGMVLGTPPYMSPEQFTGQPLDARSDVYSLAVMAYEMLTGALPFDASTAWEWATLHMTAPPKAIEAAPHGAALPEAARASVMRALAKNKEQRFDSIGEFYERFAGKVAPSAVEVAQSKATANHRSIAPEGRAPTTDMPEAAPPALSPFAPGGPAAAHAQPGPPAASSSERGRTQIGEPLMMPGAFDANAPGGTHNAPPMAAPPGAFAAPAYAPAPGPAYQPPPPVRAADTRGGGGGRGPLLVVAGLVGLLSIGFIAWGAGAFDSDTKPDVPPLDLGGGAPTIDMTSTAAPTETGPATVDTSPPLVPGPVAPLPASPLPAPAQPAPKPQPQPQPPAPQPQPPAPQPPAPQPQPPAPQPQPPVPQPPVPQPPVPQPPVPRPPVPQPPAPSAEPEICARARSAQARGSPAAASLIQQCRAAGGRI